MRLLTSRPGRVAEEQESREKCDPLVVGAEHRRICSTPEALDCRTVSRPSAAGNQFDLQVRLARKGSKQVKDFLINKGLIINPTAFFLHCRRQSDRKP